MDSLSIFDFGFFGGEAEEKTTANEVVGKEVTDININDTSFEENVDIEDEEDDSVDISTDDDDKSSSKAHSSSTAAKKGLKGTDQVTLPVVVKGDGFKMTVDGFGMTTFDAVIKDIYDHGYKVVGMEKAKVVYSESDHIIYVISPDSQSKLADGVTIADSTAYTFMYGLEQMEVTSESFSDKEKDEVSVMDLQELVKVQFPAYAGCDLAIDNKAQVAIPILVSTSNSGKITLPLTVNVNGEDLVITDIGKDKVDLKGINEYLKNILALNGKGYPVYACVKEWDGKYYCHYTAYTSNAEVSYQRKPFVLNANGKAEAAKRYFKLPLNVAIPLFNQNLQLTSEQMSGKEKVTEDEVLALLKGQFSSLASKDRKLETIFESSINTLSIVLNSGTKGAYVLPEAAESGLYKLLRTAEEVKEAVKERFFLANYCPDGQPAERIEVNPCGVYIGTMGKDINSFKVKEVSFTSKLPKIPLSIYEEIVGDFQSHTEIERIVRIYWDSNNNAYRIVKPNNDRTVASKGRISYSFDSVPSSWYLYVTIHSHNTMPAYFSSTDDADEDYTGLFGVIGTVDTCPTYSFRVGMNGTHSNICFEELFENGGE